MLNQDERAEAAENDRRLLETVNFTVTRMLKEARVELSKAPWSESEQSPAIASSKPNGSRTKQNGHSKHTHNNGRRRRKQ